LQDCFRDLLPKKDWREIFVNRWRSPEEFCGHILVRDGQVKGYLGLLFSSRIFGGRVEKFCNMTSWCVSEDSRGQGLFMLLEALKLKDYTFTNFTASPAVAAILSRLGFTEFEVHQRVIFPVPSLRLRKRRWVCEFGPREIRGRLGEDDRIIFDDHQQFNCEHLLLRSDAGYSYAVLKKTWRKHMPFAKIHYLSHPENFIEGVESLAAKICVRLKVVGLMVDERYLGGRGLRLGVRYPHQRKGYFKSSSSILGGEQIDTLYSELVVIHS
jgi:hypothetical protein